jgi:hypothetical protein
VFRSQERFTGWPSSRPLSPAAALDLLVIVLLLVAAHGAYGLARRFGADRPGAVLAGIAFAGSGYIACQLKHLGIVSTIVWLPVGLLFIDRALDVSAPTTRARRALFMAVFGLVFRSKCSRLPQSAISVRWSAARSRCSGRSRSTAPRILTRTIGVAWRAGVAATGRGGRRGRSPPIVRARRRVRSIRGSGLGVVDAVCVLAAERPDLPVPYAHGDISTTPTPGLPFSGRTMVTSASRRFCWRSTAVFEAARPSRSPS